MPQRSSSFRYALTYDQSQNQPTEFDSVVTWSYDNTSPSASRPNPATLEDSNYTQQAYTLARYRGSKLKSLDYNFFTPSGTVAPIQAQPTAPYNVGYGYSSSVAEEFLDGATGSYTGDLSFGQTSCINKNPQYIAHFQSSFSPTSFYQSMQFDIDQLIEIPMESIAGQEITPNSIDVTGDNKNKKPVSSVFEPNRKLQMTFDDLTFNGIQYGTLGAGPFRILNSATVFKTINSNARNFANESQAYQYQQAGVPVSSSVQTPQGVIQMVTGSNILDSFDLPAEVTALGEIINSGTGYSTGGPASTTGGNGSGLTVGVVAASGFVTSVSIVNAGDGYLPGDRVKVLGSGDGNCEVEISTVGATPVQHNGFLLSGSNTLFTLTGVATGIVIETVGASGTTGVKNTTAAGGSAGTGLRVNVVSVTGGGGLSDISLDAGGTDYAVGDVLNVTGFNSAQVRVTSVEDNSNQFLPFATSSTPNDPPIPPDYRLEVAGPQLALYHTYNKLVESGSTRQDPQCLTSPISQSTLWIKDGLDPRDKDNYYSWYPSGSNCLNYADYQEPFLINRGDIIRVEGLREIFVANSQPSQSLSFTKDFTVLNVQNFRNSASATTVTGGAFINNSAGVIDIFRTTANATSVTFPYNAANPNNDGFQTDGAGVSGSVTLTSTATSKFFITIDDASLTTGASTGYAIGDTITISDATLDASAFGSTVGAITITLTSANVQGSGAFGATGFTLRVDDQCWNGGTERYIQQTQGAIETVTPTFLEVTPNPLVALNGLQGGAITKFTVRRELEQDNRVMIRNITAPSGSKGTRTQSGGGYIIPNDLTLQQKENALNIINQLRAKNAFPDNNQSSS